VAGPTFDGLRVVSLESRRATEIRTLIERMGGVATVAPALKEVPLQENTDAVDFAEAMTRGAYDMVILLTGAGVRALFETLERALPEAGLHAVLEQFARTKLVARGPKPVAALREHALTPWAIAPDPNTWREVVAAIDARTGGSLAGQRIAVQEYGVSNPELLAALAERGARVARVPVYRWTLPDDITPLRQAIASIAGGAADVLLITSGIQFVHLLDVARADGKSEALRDGLARMVIASIGPSATAEMTRTGVRPDVEAAPPKMGVLVREAAEHAREILARKR
jgi:uroporphyrinogen-III synthase